MRRARTFVVLSLVASLAIAAMVACSSFGEEEPLTPSSEGGPEAASPDSPTNNPPPGGADAGRDGTASNCGAVHAFCDDFDLAPLGSVPVWSAAPVIEAPARANVRAYAEAISLPNVLEVSGTNGKQAVLTNQFTTPRGVRCSFSMRVTEAASGNTAPSVSRLTLEGEGSARYEADLRLDSIVASGSLSDGGLGKPSLMAVDTKPDDVWKRVTLEILFGAGGHVSLDIDKQLLFTFAGSTASIPKATKAQLSLGVLALSSAGTWTVLFDDVVCDRIP